MQRRKNNNCQKKEGIKMPVCSKKEPCNVRRCPRCGILVAVQGDSYHVHLRFCTGQNLTGKHAPKKDQYERVLHGKPSEVLPESEPVGIQEEPEKIIRWENGGFTLENTTDETDDDEDVL
jgi:hypothetical protein